VTLRQGPARAERGGSIGSADRGAEGPLKDDASGVVVYVPDFKAPAARRTQRLTIHQDALRSEIVPLVVGTTASFLNLDPEYHALFSPSPTRPFDLGMLAPRETAEVRFDTPGLVEVFCNLHPSMAAYLLVLQNPAFALSDADGAFALTGIPPGRHKLVAWTPRARPLVTIVEVPEGGDVELDLTVDETLTLAPHLDKFGLPYPDSGGK
jgi:plastocyanin